MNFAIAAYAVIWIGVFGYVFLIGRRIARLESEIAKLKK